MNRPLPFQLFACVAIGGAVAAAVVIGVFWLAAFMDVARARREFPSRHREATAAIERVYAHYARSGSWPSEDELRGQLGAAMPGEWEYRHNEGSPLVHLPGPYHMSLVYYFRPPENNAVSRRWLFGWEGDKRPFEADVEYRLSDAAERADVAKGG